MLYSPRRCEGIWLSDGEGMERLWSYLRRFGRMTKEKHQAHRVDVLSASFILSRWDRTLKTKVLAEETLHDLMSGFCSETESTIKKWLHDEMVIFSKESDVGLRGSSMATCVFPAFTALLQFKRSRSIYSRGFVSSDKRCTIWKRSTLFFRGDFCLMHAIKSV